MVLLVVGIVIIAYVVGGRVLRRRNAGQPAGSKPAGSKAQAKPACRWSKTGNQSGAFTEYRCERCAVKAFGRVDQPPKDCKKQLTGWF